jgi:hypothetical protein
VTGGAISTTSADEVTGTADPGWRFPILLYLAVLAVLLVVSWQTTAHVSS